jgi:putative phosphoesterase
MAQEHLVGLVTDTHDNKAAVEAAVRLFNERDVSLVLHGGDYIAPFNARWMRPLSAPLIGVFGNNDGERFGLRAQFEGIGPIHRGPYGVSHGDRRILLMHEPDEVEALAVSGAYDAIVYGHTHEIDVRTGDTLVVNPGEAGGWLSGRCTAGILDLARLSVEIVDL